MNTSMIFACVCVCSCMPLECARNYSNLVNVYFIFLLSVYTSNYIFSSTFVVYDIGEMTNCIVMTQAFVLQKISLTDIHFIIRVWMCACMCG